MPEINEKTSEYIAKGAIFLLSLIFHIAGFSFVLHLKFTYRVYDLKQKSVSAFIVPKEIIVVIWIHGYLCLPKFWDT